MRNFTVYEILLISSQMCHCYAKDMSNIKQIFFHDKVLLYSNQDLLRFDLHVYQTTHISKLGKTVKITIFSNYHGQ